MGLPKRRTSRARKLKRRAQWKLKSVTLVTCSNCGSPKQQHRICGSCGYYAGRVVAAVPNAE